MKESLRTLYGCWLVIGVLAVGGRGDEPQAGQPATAEKATDTKRSDEKATEAGLVAVEKLFEQARPSLAVITVPGRDGRQHGLGTGFVVAEDGLIATNLHVIGEGRPIAVQLADGKRYNVTAVHASDRFLDLALVRIDAKGLVPLALGNSQSLRQGEPVVALGNPQGLRHSIVTGVVSGRREIQGRQMIQLAIPLEPGNSGGPLVDLQGRVRGILTMKSAVTANLGFAMGVDELRPLLDKPNPVPIARWVKQGALDPEQWKSLFGANWHQRAGRIVVDGEGDGFGGRSLCLAKAETPELPYEITVSVRLGDEAGAAGLVFASDGGDKHYGFYPSGGRLRLTRFDGPDVLHWTILSDRPSIHYEPQEWNTLKVRVEPERIMCSVNGQVVATVKVDSPPSGQVGLAKFRDTAAEFKAFQLAKEIGSPTASPELSAKIDKLLADLPPGNSVPPQVVTELAPDSSTSVPLIAERAAQLERQAERLRRLSEAVRQAKVHAALTKLLAEPEEQIDLWAGALWVARLDNDEVDVEFYRRRLERMVSDIAEGVAAGDGEPERMAALNKFFFAESGFHGSRGDYYNRANSYVNQVLDDREGLPITLSVIYMELARRLGLKVEGVGLPGHFVVRYRPAAGESRLIDVFEGDRAIGPEEAIERVLAATGAPPTEVQQQAMTKHAILARMLHNLLGGAQRAGDQPAMLRYLDAILTVAPQGHQDRLLRAMVRWRAGDQSGAAADADWLLKNEPAGVDLEQLRDFRAMLEKAEQ